MHIQQETEGVYLLYSNKFVIRYTDNIYDLFGAVIYRLQQGLQIFVPDLSFKENKKREINVCTSPS